MLSLKIKRIPKLSLVNKRYIFAIRYISDLAKSMAQAFDLSYFSTYIRGSSAHGAEHCNSDLDIVIFVKKNIEADYSAYKRALYITSQLVAWPFYIGIKVFPINQAKKAEPIERLDSKTKHRVIRYLNFEIATNAVLFDGSRTNSQFNTYKSLSDFHEDMHLIWGREIKELYVSFNAASEFEVHYALIKKLCRFITYLRLSEINYSYITLLSDSIETNKKLFPHLSKELDQAYEILCSSPLFFTLSLSQITAQLIHKLVRLAGLQEQGPPATQETIPKPHGRFWVCRDGFILNDTSKSNIIYPWNGMIQPVIDQYTHHYQESLHSVYLRGSVPRGTAIQQLSDFDTYCVLKPGIESNNKNWIEAAEHSFSKKYNYLTTIDFYVLAYEEIFPSTPNINRISQQHQFVLSTQSICIYGTDLTKKVPLFKADYQTALILTLNIEECIEKVKLGMLQAQTVEIAKAWCAWGMKVLLRNELIMAMPLLGKFTRDLYWCYEGVIQVFPEFKEVMYKVLYYALNPTFDFEEVACVLHWLNSNRGL